MQVLNGRDYVVFQLVSAESYKDLLPKIPHVPYLDLEIVFCLFTGNRSQPQLITNELQHEMGVSTWELIELARKNTPRLMPVCLKDIRDIIGLAPDADEAPKLTRIYVFTNQQNHLGASAILYPDMLSTLAAVFGRSFYLLPSSTHEWLIHLFTDSEPAMLKETIAMVNNTELSPDEILSYSLYKYDVDENRLMIV